MIRGSGENGEMTSMDWIALLGLVIGFENLELNVTQDSIDKQTQELQKELETAIQDIHNHLQEQDMKIDAILDWVGIGEFSDDSRAGFSKNSIPHD